MPEEVPTEVSLVCQRDQFLHDPVPTANQINACIYVCPASGYGSVSVKEKKNKEIWPTKKKVREGER